MRNRNPQPAPLDLTPAQIEPIRIYGQLKGPMNNPLSNAVIRLKAITTNVQIVQELWSEVTTDTTGNYDFLVYPGRYAVFIKYAGKEQRINNIQVYADSAPGSLQSFMLAPTADTLTPLAILEVKAALELSQQALMRSRQWAENPEDLPVLDFDQGTGPEFSAYHWAKKAAQNAAEAIGLTWRDDWDTSAQYAISDAVFYEGSSWIAVADNIGITPVEGDVWNMLAKKGDIGLTGMNWRGLWDASKIYNHRDGVQYHGDAWFCLQTSQNIEPIEGEYWSLFAQGGEAEGDYLKINYNLSEIATAGAEAQQASRNNLGLGSASTHDAQETVTDATAGRLLINGAWGIGGPQMNIPDNTDIYQFFATAKSGNYGGGGALTNVITSGWHGFRWSQHGEQSYGFLIELGSNRQMALHVYNNPTNDMVSPQNYWTNSGIFYSPTNKPAAVDNDFVSKAYGGAFQNPISVENVGASYPFKISGYSPAVLFEETDTNKKYYLLVDGGDMRLDEDSTVGNNVWAWKSVENEFRINGAVIPSVYTNFDARYITDVSLGAERWQDYGGGSAVKAGPGETLIGLQESQDDNEIHGYWFKPIQKYVSGSWVTISG